MQTLYVIAIIVGLFSLTAAIVIVLAAAILKHCKTEPEPDSNEALRNWLLSNPGADIDDYLHNKPDRCVIR